MNAAILPGLFLALGAVSAHAALPAYGQVELQARSKASDPASAFNLPPGSVIDGSSAAINNGASVAFAVTDYPGGVDPSAHSSGLWSGAHASGSIVLAMQHAYIDSAGYLCMNDRGQVAFTILARYQPNFLELYDPIGGGRGIDTLNRSSFAPCVNSEGDVDFSGGGGMYAVNVAGTTTVYAEVQDQGPYYRFGIPGFNDGGTMAGRVETSPDGDSIEILAFERDGSVHPLLANYIVDPASPYADFDQGLALNDAGEVAVVAAPHAGRRTLLRTDGSTTATIASVDPAGTIRGIDAASPAINGSGWVLFRGKDAAGAALYLGDGADLVRVAGVGDTIETDLGLAEIGNIAGGAVFSGNPALNERGDVAFIAAVHPAGDTSTDWGLGVFVAYAELPDAIFGDGFDAD